MAGNQQKRQKENVISVPSSNKNQGQEFSNSQLYFCLVTPHFLPSYPKFDSRFPIDFTFAEMTELVDWNMLI
jgi:hypothetical protein